MTVPEQRGRHTVELVDTSNDPEVMLSALEAQYSADPAMSSLVVKPWAASCFDRYPDSRSSLAP